MTEPDFEAALRDQLAATVLNRTPGEAPYEAIRRQGLAARRRRTVAFSAALVGLIAVSGTALAVGRHGNDGPGTVAASAAGGAPAPAPASVSASPSAAAATTGATPAAEPQPPSSPAQLADGITFAQAATALGQCLEFDRQTQPPAPTTTPGAQTQTTRPPRPTHDLGALSDYRILMAMKQTGDDNAPGDGIVVVGISQGQHPDRIVCHQTDGKTSGVQSGGAGPRAGGPAGLVDPDVNAGKLYRQAMLDGHPWKLPYRWGSIGTFGPSVARVTVSYGRGPAVDAALDHGWFAATGTLDAPVTRAPHIKGYDSGGKLVYDSDDDKGYAKEL
ncbi:hypothetical protein [Kitasatospora sp. NPDC047058]|uniref:hypothetical protein n=1 Tax=Kitasatospora sp. NPDC047058 TaxID=3155620 RepID=UPI0033F9DF85